MERKAKMIIVAFVTILVGVTFAIYLSQGEENLDWIKESLISEPDKPRYDYLEGVQLGSVNMNDGTLNNITGDFRPIYEDMKPEDYEKIFGNLLPFPQDFFAITSLIYDGKITDYERVGSEYFMQPEFYVSWFGTYDKYYLNNDPNSWKPRGYGCFPMIKQATAKRGTTIQADTYFRTGFATESYQGLVIKPTFPESAFSAKGNELFTQSLEDKKYFDIRIISPDNPIYLSFKDDIVDTSVQPEDWFIVLKPTYSNVFDSYGKIIDYVGFPSDWIRILNYEIEIDKDTPRGDYVFSIEIADPSFEINQEFYFAKDHEYYGKKYVSGAGILQAGIPHFQLILHVI